MSGFTVQRDEASAPFFDAAARAVLLLRRCGRCGSWYPPQQAACPADATRLQWVPAAGTATLVSWAVEHGPVLHPALGAPGGHTSVVGLIELAEGPWMHAAVVGTDPAALAAGTPLQVRFVQLGDEAVPVVTPYPTRRHDPPSKVFTPGAVESA